MATIRSCLERCFGQDCGDGLLWYQDLKPHASGEFSMAVVQANCTLEDQAQVVSSPFATFIGVYDGHGGPDTSRFVNTQLFPHFHKFAMEQRGVSADVIRKAIVTTEEDFLNLVQHSWPDKPQFASVGSCCLVGAITEDTVFIGNLGDSRVVLGRRAASNGKEVVAERLTSDHNAADVEIRKELKIQHPDDSAIVVHTRGVWRIKGIIQVSRTIGDAYLKIPEYTKENVLPPGILPTTPLTRAVLTAEPSIHTRKLKQEDDLFLIFASDGLWELLTDDTAVQIVSQNPRPGIARRLLRAALEEAAKKVELRYNDMRKIHKGVRRHFHDDITIVVVFLDHNFRAAKSRGLKAELCRSTSTPADIFSYYACGSDSRLRPEP